VAVTRDCGETDKNKTTLRMALVPRHRDDMFVRRSMADSERART
jgi:hypothetical protein